MSEEAKLAEEARIKAEKDAAENTAEKDESFKKKEDLEREYAEKLKEAVALEKTKLYETIEKEKEKASKLEAELALARAIKKEEADKEEEKRKEELDAKERIKELEAKQNEDSEKFRKILELQDKKYQLELDSRDLNLYKQQQINALKGKIIPELVSGSTKEEIDAAVKVAAERYELIVSSVKKSEEAEFLAGGKLPDTGKGKYKKEGESDNLEPTYQKLMEMDSKAFEEYSKEFLAKL